MNEIKVLDHGYVRLLDSMGDDASIANAARISYDKGTKKTSDDRNLIRYLIRNHHTSPVEMVELQFEIKAPLFVIQQILRHRTANINQMSLRYSEAFDEFYIPELDRLQPQSKSNKQGSEGKLTDAEAKMAQYIIKDSAEHALNDYEQLISDQSCRGGDDFSCAVGTRQGLSRELARIVLPSNNYSKLVWKIDLKNLLHFLKLRMDSHAQWEIQQYAEAIYELIKPIVPCVIEAWNDYEYEGTHLSRMEKNFLLTLLGSDLNAKDCLAQLIQIHGSEVEVMKSFELGKREWSELKAKLLP
jgi:thymidylate synthase (FAD)